jgi:hypothetical protein
VGLDRELQSIAEEISLLAADMKLAHTLGEIDEATMDGFITRLIAVSDRWKIAINNLSRGE